MAEKTSREWIRWVLLFLFFAALYGIPHRSPWFGLVLLSLILAGLFAVGSMLWVALRVRIAAGALARTAPIRALHPREVDALTWLGTQLDAVFSSVRDLPACANRHGCLYCRPAKVRFGSKADSSILGRVVWRRHVRFRPRVDLKRRHPILLVQV